MEKLQLGIGKQHTFHEYLDLLVTQETTGCKVMEEYALAAKSGIISTEEAQDAISAIAGAAELGFDVGKFTNPEAIMWLRENRPTN